MKVLVIIEIPNYTSTFCFFKYTIGSRNCGLRVSMLVMLEKTSFSFVIKSILGKFEKSLTDNFSMLILSFYSINFEF